jgi:hypothetical protein
MNRIAIRREHHAQWNRCAPVVPDDVVDLVVEDIPIVVERSPTRAFVDAAYEAAGAAVVDDADDADVVVAIQEESPEAIDAPRTWLFFSDTAAGEPQNMPVLDKILATKGTLFDYELIVNDEEERLLQFVDLDDDADAIEISHRFSAALRPLIPSLARADLQSPTLDDAALPSILRRACIAWRGELTEPFRRLQAPLKKYGSNA